MSQRNKEGNYERLEERVKRTGVYELVLPFDYIMLDILPVEGTTFAGLYELGETAGGVQKQIPQVSSGTIGARLRILELQGLTRKIRGLGHATSKWTWQATEKGKELIKPWKENKNGSH